VTAARFTLTLAGLPLGEAQKLAARIDDDWRIETLAVAVNEIDEARGLWETVVYFEDEAAARAADAAGLPGLVSPARLTGSSAPKAWRRSRPGVSFCMDRTTGRAVGPAASRSRSMPEPPSAPAITAPRKPVFWHSMG
jgi:hypothetical protein